jgi:hypothetical protein
MINDIFHEIYILSLLNLYIYTDCTLFSLLPSKKLFQHSLFGTEFNETIHRVNYNDMFDPSARTIEQKEMGYPIWIDRITHNLNKIDHIYLDCILDPYYVLFSSKGDNLYVTFRGTGNLKETSLDIRIFLNSYIAGQLSLDEIKDIITDMYSSIKKKIKHLRKSHHLSHVIFSGHSLGALLACVYLVRAIQNGEAYLNGKHGKNYFLVLFGMPSFGDAEFKQFAELKLGSSYINVCNNNDLIMTGSGMFVSHLNNVIKLEYESFHGTAIQAILSDNSILQNASGKLTFKLLNDVATGPLPLLTNTGSFISHMIPKYVETIYYFLQNISTNTIILDMTEQDRFTKIFKILSKRFFLDETPILMQKAAGRRKVSRSKNKNQNNKISRRSKI